MSTLATHQASRLLARLLVPKVVPFRVSHYSLLGPVVPPLLLRLPPFVLPPEILPFGVPFEAWHRGHFVLLLVPLPSYREVFQLQNF